MNRQFAMYSRMEAQIIRTLAVAALAAAFLAAALITFDSGILGGGSSGSAGPDDGIDATASAAPAEAPAPVGETPGQTTPASDKTYVVQDGDSFYTIARKYDTTIAEIQQLNPNVDPQNLSAGTRLVVP